MARKTVSKDNVPAWWTVDDVLHVIFADKLSRSSFYTLCRNGDVPFTRFGTKYFIPNSWVQFQLHQGNAISFTDPAMNEFLNGHEENEER